MDDFLTPKELADKLKVPIGSIYYWTSRNEIPYTRVGRHLRFNLKAVLNHFDSMTHGAQRACLPPGSSLRKTACKDRSLTSDLKDSGVSK